MNTRKPKKMSKELKEVAISFRLPWSTVHQIDEAARDDGSSRSLIIRRLVLEKFPVSGTSK